MTEAQIKHMVDRFLGWKLPENFNPDGGIVFKKTFNNHMPFGPQKNEPVGTNLFDADQAMAMVRHMLEGLPQDGSVPDRETWWLVERKVSPPQYVVQKYSELPSLTDDPWRAARFATEREAFDYRLRLVTLRDECKETEHVFINKR